MYTYTTPTITCVLAGVEFDLVDIVRIAIKGKDEVLKIIEASDIDAETGSLTVKLTQEETASIGSGQIAIQARVRYRDGTVQATNKVLRQMSDVIDKVVI